MQKFTSLLGGTALVVVGATAASAGGMETGRFNPGFLFESGNYAEFSFSQTAPSVTDNLYAPDSSMLETYSTVNGAVKYQISDKFAIGLSTYDSGKIELSYEGAGGPFAGIPYAALNPALAALGTLPEPYVSLSQRSTALVLNYSVSDRLAVFGGVKYVTSSATGNIIANPIGDLTAESGSATSQIIGASYSIPDIALRVTGTYQSKAEMTHETTSSFVHPLVQPALSDSLSYSPEMITLDFQTGIASNTLLFGSIHHAKWGDANIKINGADVSTWTDTTSYSVGVGRKLNDNWAVSGSLNYEAATASTGTSLLSTTDGVQGVSVGAKYTQGNMNISGGVNYSMLGDKDVTSLAGQGSFKDNSAITMGMKVGFNF